MGKKKITEDDLVLLDGVLDVVEDKTPQEINAINKVRKALRKLM